VTITLGASVEIVVEPPAIPTFADAPPASTELEILPVPGVPGPPGPAGEPGSPGDAEAVAAHIADPTPHAVYDEGPSLLLLYENAKV
jgi:hypothetical protein